MKILSHSYQGPGPFYVFECGHIAHRIMIRKRTGQRVLCPKCKSKLASKIFICKDCGVAIERKAAVQIQKRCESCHRLHRTVTHDNYKGDLDDSLSVAARSMHCDQRKADCEHYAECLTRAAIKNWTTTHCKNCQFYKPVKLHAEISSFGDTFSPSNYYGHDRSRL